MEDILMAYKQFKKDIISLIISQNIELSQDTTMRTRKLKLNLKKQTGNTKCWENIEQPELSCSVVIITLGKRTDRFL